MAWVMVLILLVGIVWLSLFAGSPKSRFRVYRVYRIAVHLDKSIENAFRESTIDMFGNLSVVARNRRFFIYQWYHRSDVETIAKLMARKKGFKNAYVEFGKDETTFKFKLLNR